MKYEIMFTAKPKTFNEVKKELSNIVENNRGTIVNIEDWGEKSLPSKTKECNTGHFGLCTFKAAYSPANKITEAVKLIEADKSSNILSQVIFELSC